jgi:hypothetical protein
VPSLVSKARKRSSGYLFFVLLKHHDRVRDVQVDAHLFGGWYDIFLRQLLDDYAALVGAGKNPYLTIGLYPHGSVRMFIDLQRDTFAWFGSRLKGETDKAREKPVRLYVMGSGEWRDFDAWPARRGAALPPPPRRGSLPTSAARGRPAGALPLRPLTISFKALCLASLKGPLITCKVLVSTMSVSHAKR